MRTYSNIMCWGLLLSYTCLVFADESAQQPRVMLQSVTCCPPEFVVVIPSYNNELYAEKNLCSILDQNYNHFRVIYINDASTDKTASVVTRVLANHPKGDLVEVIHNKTRQGAGLNRYLAFHTIPDHNIIVECDGDDWLAHNEVLTRLSEVYQDPNVWLTYGQFRREPGGTIGQSKPIPPHILANNIYRFDDYYTSMLRTYYAVLYKQVWLQDILAGGKPFSTGTDLAVMIPMIEMAGSHARYIDEILYIVNRYNTINTEKVVPDKERAWNDRIIRQYKRQYTPLAELSNTKSCGTDRIHAIFLSDRTPDAMMHLLRSMAELVMGVTTTTVLYHADECTIASYKKVMELFPCVLFIELPDAPDCLKSTLLKVLKRVPAQYVFLGSDQSTFTKTLSLSECAYALQQTYAHGFYFRMEVNIPRPWAERRLMPPLITLHDRGEADSIYAWQFTAGGGAWYMPRNAEMALYKTSVAYDTIKRMVFDTRDIMHYVWARIVDLDGIGLCLGRSVTGNNPHALVQLCDITDAYYIYDGVYVSTRDGIEFADPSVWQRAKNYVLSLSASLCNTLRDF